MLPIHLSGHTPGIGRSKGYSFHDMQRPNTGIYIVERAAAMGCQSGSRIHTRGKYLPSGNLGRYWLSRAATPAIRLGPDMSSHALTEEHWLLQTVLQEMGCSTREHAWPDYWYFRDERKLNSASQQVVPDWHQLCLHCKQVLPLTSCTPTLPCISLD